MTHFIALRKQNSFSHDNVIYSFIFFYLLVNDTLNEREITRFYFEIRSYALCNFKVTFNDNSLSLENGIKMIASTNDPHSYAPAYEHFLSSI